VSSSLPVLHRKLIPGSGLYGRRTFIALTPPGGLSGKLAPLSTLYPSGLAAPTGTRLATRRSLGSTVSFLDQSPPLCVHPAIPIDMEHELPFRMAFKSATREPGRNLQISTTGTTGYNINQLPDQYMNAYHYQAAIEHLLDGHRSRLRTCAMLSAAGSATLNQAFRPFEGFTSVTALVSGLSHCITRWLCGWRRAASHGLSFLATYYWSSTWDSVFGCGHVGLPGTVQRSGAKIVMATYR